MNFRVFMVHRLVGLLVVLLGITLLVFVMSNVAQTDPARAALGPFASQASVDRYRAEHGLDQPLWTQYAIYMRNLFRGDLGVSILQQRPILEELKQAIPATLELVIPSLIFALLVGVTLGIVGALYANRWLDYLTRLLSTAGMSMPMFWLGVILQIIFFGRLGWLPAAGRLPPAEIGVPNVTGFTSIDALLAHRWDLFVAALKHMVLPVLALSAINLATIARISRSTLLDVLHKRYIVVARSKGLKESLVLIRHALPNAIIPLVTIFGLMIGESLQGSVVIETIFAWPGIGRRVITSLLRADIPMISAYALLLAATYGITNLLVDLSYYILDPRIRGR